MFSFLRKKRALAVTGISAVLLVSTAFAKDENISITTYYPSPHAAYKTVRLYPTTVPSTCVAAAEGTVYYNSTVNRLMVCTAASDGTYGWKVVPGGGYLVGTVAYSTLDDYHDNATAAPDTVERSKATMTACDRWCSNGCQAGDANCTGVLSGHGFHGGTAVEWSSSNVECLCH